MEQSPTARGFDLRLALAILLLAPAIFFTQRTMNELSARREIRYQLAEIGHARYGIFNADRWVEQILPVIRKQVDTLDLTANNGASLRPMVEKSLYRLLDQLKEQIAPKPKPGAPPPGFAAQATAMMATAMLNNLKPQVPQFAGVVLSELGSKENKEAIKKYISGIIADGAKNTFSPVDMTYFNAILKQNGCPDAQACRVILGNKIAAHDSEIQQSTILAVAAAALAFILLLVRRPALRWYEIVVLMALSITLLIGGVFSPMLEVEAKISKVGMTFFGSPVSFDEQIFYYQSKTVLEVFRTLIEIGQWDMMVVAILLVTFSIVFPALKMLTLGVCLMRREWLRTSRIARFFALESSKWSMADVLALATFMSYVAFNGVISNALGGLKAPGAQIVIPTDSSKVLAGFYLFLGFVLASLFLSWKLERDLKAGAVESRPQPAA
ncbi:MAG TPA: paraquat-inducible protein A [Bryobacteraceae bacterium]|nr:paraquat-inducible protein A [Bryobacteraceae bacterium]